MRTKLRRIESVVEEDYSSMLGQEYEKQYMTALKDIYENGFEQLNERTGVVTKRVGTKIFQLDMAKETPLLISKKVGVKTAIKEILWIMQKQSNNINDLDAHIWDSWADEDGSIGKAYGFQVNKPVTIGGKTYDSQVHYVLESLSADSSNRRAIIDLWNVDDLADMNLVPCCFSSVWTVVDNKLHCTLTQRSADFILGVPFNTAQYGFLLLAFARHLGVEPGYLTHIMCDSHMYMYESHIECYKEQDRRDHELGFNYTEQLGIDNKIEFIGDNTDFFSLKLSDIKITYDSLPAISVPEVAA